MVNVNKEILDKWLEQNSYSLILQLTSSNISSFQSVFGLKLSGISHIQSWGIDKTSATYVYSVHYSKLNLINMKDIVEFCLIYGYTLETFTPSWIDGCSIVVVLTTRKNIKDEIELKLERDHLKNA